MTIPPGWPFSPALPAAPLRSFFVPPPTGFAPENLRSDFIQHSGTVDACDFRRRRNERLEAHPSCEFSFFGAPTITGGDRNMQIQFRNVNVPQGMGDRGIF